MPKLYFIHIDFGKCYIFYVFMFLAIYLEATVEDSLSVVTSFTRSSIQQNAIEQLIFRLVGNQSSRFHVTVNSGLTDESKEVFEIFKSENSSIVEIKGSSGVAAAWGFNHYLKYYCSCHISWNDDQLNLPTTLPSVNIQIKANDGFRYHQNVCTWSYSYVWWGWSQWERHIDWMALNGINLALAFTGQEAIWQRVYMKLNLTEADVNDHFTGPAFLSWGRMGNIRGWSGPLSPAWHTKSLSLQRMILSRMRSLGIIPVLPAFAGHVPQALKRLYPDVNFTKTTQWGHFSDKYCCPYLLQPQEPLFKVIGAMFLKEMIHEFGTNHIYNCDTFNEMSPSSGDLDYLRNIGDAVYKSMTAVDPDAVWLIQGWIFYNDAQFWTKSRGEALLKSVPIGKMLVLDLMSEMAPQYERFDSYFGQPFIWCMLHNFGGTVGMHGTVTRVNEGVWKARNSNTSMVGVGVTMEGLNPNYVLYDLMLETGWRKTPADLSDWFTKYSERRNGQANIHLEKAWQLLKDSVYQGVIPQHGQFVVIRHPSLTLPIDVWYKPEDVMKAWDEMLAAVKDSPALTVVDTFKHDLVDLTRQALQLKVDFMYQHVMQAYMQRNLDNLSNATATFMAIMDDLNVVLASNKWFLLGSWLESAKQQASSPQERDRFEEQARNQITLWGPNGEIRDYAGKQWAYLITDYYSPRWQFFFQALKNAISGGKPFNQNDFSKAIYQEIEQPFTFSKDLYPTFEIGDTVEISQRLHKQWRHLEDHYDGPIRSKFLTPSVL